MIGKTSCRIQYVGLCLVESNNNDAKDDAVCDGFKEDDGCSLAA
jgi:hypothetical protein